MPAESCASRPSAGFYRVCAEGYGSSAQALYLSPKAAPRLPSSAMLSLFAIASSIVENAISSGDTPLTTPNTIYDSSAYSSFVAKTANGILYNVTAPDALPLPVLHLFGNAHERGVAQGTLLRREILRMMEVDLPQFYRQQASLLC